MQAPERRECTDDSSFQKSFRTSENIFPVFKSDLELIKNDIGTKVASGRQIPSTDHELVGLSLSGGGIRSAIFNFGFLQATTTIEEEKFMKTIIRLSVFVIMVAFLPGCYSFEERVDANQLIPDYWTDRDYIRTPGPLNTAITFYAGRIAYQGDDGKYVVTQRIFEGETTLEVVTLESAFNFRTVIDKNWQGEATFSVINADASGEYAREYELADIAQTIVPDKNIPSREKVNDKLPNSIYEKEPVWYIDVVALSTIRAVQSRKAKGKLKLSGSGFSIGGQVYEGESNSTYYPLISIHVQPMNAAADIVVQGKGQPSKPPPRKTARCFFNYFYERRGFDYIDPFYRVAIAIIY